jgi:hypothetical protein
MFSGSYKKNLFWSILNHNIDPYWTTVLIHIEPQYPLDYKKLKLNLLIFDRSNSFFV